MIPGLRRKLSDLYTVALRVKTKDAEHGGRPVRPQIGELHYQSRDTAKCRDFPSSLTSPVRLTR